MRARDARHYWGVVLDAPDPPALARFYAALLDWRIKKEEPGWVTLAPPEGTAYLSIQLDSIHERPTWPAERGRQQMQSHLDIEVGELEAAVAEAVALGATVADYQPQESVRVLLDPAGHPFCLYVDPGGSGQAGAVDEATGGR
jgi:catechol 2,3-dioxygenase-like lactoylglutathione lyase family enzyme